MRRATVPIAPLAAWGLLLPLAYAPVFLRGRPEPFAWAMLGAALALTAVALGLARAGRLEALAAAIEPRAGTLLAGAIVAYVVASTAASARALAAFGDYDQLGIFAQSFWTLFHGLPFANSMETVDGTAGSHLGVHFSPALLALAPAYAVARAPLALLAAQAAAVALAAVPVWALARARIGGAGALALALAFLALPNFAWAGVRDFHDANFLPLALVTAFWALETGRRGVLFAAALVALGVREDAGLPLVMLGVYAVLAGRGARTGAALAALGAAWLVVATQWVIPRFGSPGLWMDSKRFFADVLGQWGATPLEAAARMASHPADLARALADRSVLRYAYDLLLPLLLLPPLASWAALPAVPGALINALSRLPWMRSSHDYYSVVPLAFLFLATASAAMRVAERAGEAKRASGLALGAIVLAGALPAMALQVRIGVPPAPPAAAARALVAMLPDEAPVYAPSALYTALHRREMFGCWENLGALGREPAMRGRFAWIALWLDGDPPGEVRDRALADSLARDPRFERVGAPAPFLVWRRR